MNKKKIAFFVTSLDSGGIENYLLRFLKHYEGDINAIVYCKAGRLGILEQEFRNIGAILNPFPLGYFNLLNYINLYRDLIEKRVDAVCDFTGNYAALPLLTAKFAGINKRVAFFRGATRHFKETPLRLLYDGLMNKVLYFSATKILSNSQAALDYFYPKKIKETPNFFEVIYNGVDVSKFLSTKDDLREELSIPKHAFVVGHIGRVAPAKNHKTIVEVAIMLTKENPDIYFVLCGANTRKEFGQLIEEKKLNDQIKLLGVRRDIINVLNTLNCFYFPSITEGQPNALIEAMVVGIPFVASDIDPIKETVPAKFYNFLIPAKDKFVAINKIKSIKTMDISALSEFIVLAEKMAEQYSAGKLFKKFYNNF